MRRSVLPLLVLAALTAVSLASAAPTRSAGTNLTIVGYSIPTAVFPKLTAAYQSTPQITVPQPAYPQPAPQPLALP